MKIKDAMQTAINKCKVNNIDESSNKVRRIMSFVTGIEKSYLLVHNMDELNTEHEKSFFKYIEELVNGRPVQYILGHQEFMGINLIVNEDVLIPQPDTEILVEETIKIAQKFSNPKILDLCTGSGAIAVSLSKFVPNAKLYASDISQKALETAKMNSRNQKIKFIQSNLFENINDIFDIIVTNPPYIKTDEISILSKEVQNEPTLALDGGQDGLVFYRQIIKQANDYLKHNGYLCMEIGEDQKEEVLELIKQEANYVNIKTYKDLSGNDRVITCKKI